MKVGYLGPAGTFSHSAFDYFSTRQPALDGYPYPQFSHLFQALQSKDVESVVAPIENSLEGAVNATLDFLVSSEQLWIMYEFSLPIHHALLATKKVSLSEITDVYSHYQPLAQCQHYLQKKLPSAILHTSNSTAAAATFIKEEKNPFYAAIGRIDLAKRHGLVILDEGIQDVQNNKTRFVVIGGESAPATGCDKTSIVLTTAKDQPGSLNAVLSVFAESGINLTRIESRPAKTSLGHYLFFIDLEGHIQDNKMKLAFDKVMGKTSFFKWLGSYPYEKEQGNHD